MSINTSIARVGNFTSSEIVALTLKGKGEGSFGVKALTYINECNMERRLMRSISDEVNARPLCWGKLVELKAFESLGLEYSLSSQETMIHPIFNFWSGSADGFKDEKETVADIKCPMTLKSFCNLVDPYIVDGKIIHPALTIEAVRANHTDGDKFYWQIVSNGTIHGCKYGELIIYMPYQRELADIREMIQDLDPGEMYKYFWIANGNDEELPHLIEGGYYKNINIIRFEIPQEDKDFLTERVEKAGKLLQDFYKQPAI